MAAPTDDVKKDAKKDAKRDVKDGKAFYGYLYDKRKKPIPEPTPLHNALLRAIALHIVRRVMFSQRTPPSLTGCLDRCNRRQERQ